MLADTLSKEFDNLKEESLEFLDIEKTEFESPAYLELIIYQI